MWNIPTNLPETSAPGSRCNSRNTRSSLRNRNHQVGRCTLIALGLLPLMGCIAHNGSQQQRISVTITPSPVSLAVGGQQKFTASVTGTSNTAVTWSLSLSPNSASTASGTGLGTIDSNGNYTAPSTIPSCASGIQQCELQVAITATSQDNTSYSGQAAANVHVVITVSPASDTIGQGANLQYVATVTGTTNQTVQWNATGGGAFDPGNPGLYIAPQLPQGTSTENVSITATSSFDQSQVATATMTVQETDPLGTATPSTAAAAAISCPAGGLTGATCYKVNVACDGIANYSAYLKVNLPTGSPLGTVIFGTGAGGSSLYDNDPNFVSGSFNGGLTVVQDLLNSAVTDKGFTTVQVSFGSPFDSSAATANGWLQGPGGVRRLACRFATVADWIYKNIHNSNTNAPMCGTGNSGGSGALGYAVTQYGLAPEFSMIEPTSGPVMTRIHQGCSACGQFTGSDPCNQIQVNMCYSVSAGGKGSTASIIDKAYQAQDQITPTLCTDGVNGNNVNFNRFLSDSIEDDPLKTIPIPIPNPPTNVKVLFGGLDDTNAVPEGYGWWSGVAPQPPAPICVQDAPHAIPSVADGAAQIVSDIQSMCKVH